VSELGSPINFSQDLWNLDNLTKEPKATRPKKLPPIGQSEKLENKFGESEGSAFITFKAKGKLSPIQEATQKTDKDRNTSLSGLKTPSSQFLPLPPAPNKEIPVPPAPKKERPGRLKPLDQGIVNHQPITLFRSLAS
tara:strand:- start:782 stop:1192 length:411 start_codon:yes stop_codon:yes gene_type:complete